MTRDEIHVVIADLQMPVGLGHATTPVGPGATERHRQEGLLVGALAAQIHPIEEGR
jgi:hypothetical protein